MDPGIELGAAVFAGLQASFLAGIATGVGAVPVLFLRRLSHRAEDMALAFAGGVMLAATMFSLLIPGLEQGRLRASSAFAGSALIATAVLLGALLVWAIHRHLPHEHATKGREGGPTGRQLQRAWLLVLAIALHNIPEGLAVGVGAAADLAGAGTASEALTIAIAVQNMPEGLVVAIALVTIGMRRLRALLAALASGLVEPIAGTLGAFGAALSMAALPWALGLAAGAMLYVIGSEIVPETHSRGHATEATFALLGGFAVMLLLAGSLG